MTITLEENYIAQREAFCQKYSQGYLGELLSTQIKSKYGYDGEGTGYSFLTRPVNNPVSLEQFYDVEACAWEKCAAQPNAVPASFFIDLNHLRDQWAAYFIQIDCVREIDVLLAQLFMAIRSQPETWKKRDQWKQWEAFSATRYEVIYARYDRNYQQRCGIDLSQDSEKLQTIFQLLVCIDQQIKVEKLIPETQEKLCNATEIFQCVLLEKIKKMIEEVSPAEVITPFCPALYTLAQLTEIIVMCEEALLKKPRDFIAGVKAASLQVIVQSLRTASVVYASFENPLFLQALIVFLVNSHDAPLNVTVFKFLKYSEITIWLAGLVRGLGLDFLCEHPSFNALWMALVGKLSEPDIFLSVMQSAFLEDLKKSLDENDKGAFSKLANSSFYHGLIAMLKEETALSLKKEIKSKLEGYTKSCLMQESEENLLAYLGRGRALYWEHQIYPGVSQLTEAISLRFQSIFMRRLESMKPQMLGDEFLCLNSLLKEEKALKENAVRWRMLYQMFSEEKSNKITRFLQEIVAHEKTISRLEAEKQQALEDAQEKDFFVDNFRSPQKISEKNDRVRSEIENKFNSEIVLIKQALLCLVQKKEIQQKQIEQFRKKMESAQWEVAHHLFVVGVHRNILTIGGGFQAALISAVDRYLEYLTEINRLESVIHEDVILSLPGGVIFLVSESLTRIFKEKIIKSLNKVFSGEQSLSDLMRLVEQYKTHITSHDLEELIILGCVERFQEGDQEKCKKLLLSDVLNSIFKCHLTVMEMKEKIKNTLFHKNLFNVREECKNIFESVSSFLNEGDKKIPTWLSEENAIKLNVFIPFSQVKLLLHHSIKAFGMHIEGHDHFYLLALHAFILKLFDPERQIYGELHDAAEILQVLQFFETYKESKENIMSVLSLSPSDGQFIEKINLAMNGFETLYDFYHDKTHFNAMEKDVFYLIEKYLHYLSGETVKLFQEQEKQYFVRKMMSFFKKCGFERYQTALLAIVRRAMREWLSCEGDFVHEAACVLSYRDTIESSVDSMEKQALLGLLLQVDQQQKSMAVTLRVNDAEQGFQYAKEKLAQLVSKSGEVDLGVCDAQLFSVDFISFLNLNLSSDQIASLCTWVMSRSLQVQETRLLSSLLLQWSASLYGAQYDLSGEIDRYLAGLQKIDIWVPIDLQLVLIYGTELQVGRAHTCISEKLKADVQQVERPLYQIDYPRVILHVDALGLSPYRGYFFQAPSQDALCCQRDFIQEKPSPLYFQVRQFFMSVLGSQAQWEKNQFHERVYERVRNANVLINRVGDSLSGKIYFQGGKLKSYSDEQFSLKSVKEACWYADENHQAGLLKTIGPILQALDVVLVQEVQSINQKKYLLLAVIEIENIARDLTGEWDVSQLTMLLKRYEKLDQNDKKAAYYFKFLTFITELAQASQLIFSPSCQVNTLYTDLQKDEDFQEKMRQSDFIRQSLLRLKQQLKVQLDAFPKIPFEMTQFSVRCFPDLCDENEAALVACVNSLPSSAAMINSIRHLCIIFQLGEVYENGVFTAEKSVFRVKRIFSEKYRMVREGESLGWMVCLLEIQKTLREAKCLHESAIHHCFSLCELQNDDTEKQRMFKSRVRNEFDGAGYVPERGWAIIRLNQESRKAIPFTLSLDKIMRVVAEMMAQNKMPTILLQFLQHFQSVIPSEIHSAQRVAALYNTLADGIAMLRLLSLKLQHDVASVCHVKNSLKQFSHLEAVVGEVWHSVQLRLGMKSWACVAMPSGKQLRVDFFEGVAIADAFPQLQSQAYELRMISVHRRLIVLQPKGVEVSLSRASGVRAAYFSVAAKPQGAGQEQSLFSMVPAKSLEM